MSGPANGEHADQVRLFERVQPEIARVSLHDIAPWRTSGAKSATRRSIQTLGFSSAVLLRAFPQPTTRSVVDEEGTKREGRFLYEVIAGNGRLTDAEAEGIEVVPATILPATLSDVDTAAHSASSNLNRRNNVVHEAASLQRLYEACRAAGMGEAEAPTYIAKVLGIKLAVVQQRLGLMTLPRTLLEGVRSGRIAAGVAGRIASLSDAQQQELVMRMQRSGKLTGKDVYQVRLARRQDELAALPDTLFGPPKEPAEGNVHDVALRTVIEEMLATGVTPTEVIKRVGLVCQQVTGEEVP